MAREPVAPEGAGQGVFVPQIIGVVPDPPLDRLTWSGGTHHLLTGIAARGALVGAVDASPSRAVDSVARAVAFSPSRARWYERYGLSPILRRRMSATARRRVRRAARHADATLQLGAWFDVGPLGAQLRTSFHDGNIAVYLRRPDLQRRPSPALVRRAVRFERSLYSRMDLIFPMSDWLRQSFLEDFDVPEENVVTVRFGPNYHGTPAELPERDFSRPRFLFVGKDFERKGGPELIRAFAAVRRSVPHAELWVVGPTSAPESGPGVTWFGRLSRSDPREDAELRRLWSEATAYVMPSRFEPAGFVFAEAMSYGLPIVAADTGAMPEIVRPGVGGLVAPPGDAEALAEVLLEIASDADGAAEMGAESRRAFETSYNWDSVSERILSAIRGRLATTTG